MKPQSLAEFLGVLPQVSEPDVDHPTAKTLLDVADPKVFCQGILNSREFRQYVVSGITLGDIPPVVLTRIMDHGWGRPVERVEVEDKTERGLEHLTLEELEQRALVLAEAARTIRKNQTGVIH